MNIRRRFSRPSCVTRFRFLLLLAAGSAAAVASPVTWTLNATTSAGVNVVGSFEWDADTSVVSMVNITTSGGPSADDGQMDQGFWLFSTLFTFEANPAVGHAGLILGPSSALTDAGGTVGLNSGEVGVCRTSNCDTLNTPISLFSGSIGGAVATPETSSWSMLALGFAGLLGAKLARRRPGRMTSLIL